MGKLQMLLENSKSPHSILGMHQEIIEDKQKLTVTLYCEGAESVVIRPIDDQSKGYPLEKIEDGYFKGIIGRRKNKFTYEVCCENQNGECWSYVDPYQFAPLFGELDLYLFGEGTDYEIYKKLGAHKRVVGGIDGVYFAVWAPLAKRVSVIGEFNFWDGRKHPMRCMESNGVWELFIPGIDKETAYKYEIKTQDDVLLYKADPYAMMSELRPNTASKVWDETSYDWEDKQWLDTRVAKEPYKEAVSIYELHIGSWKKHLDGRFYTYRELADDLVNYIKDMGYTHIEIMGVLEHPFDGSWGYQVTGYFAPTSRYGTPDDFKYFVDVMHKNNIAVLLDWVPAHFPKDAFGLEKFDGSALYEHFNKKQAEHPEWGTLIFNYGRNEVKLFLIASALSWLENYHIDGLRVDAVASMLYLDYAREGGDYVRNAFGGRENLEAVAFIKNLNQVVYEKFPGVMMIAEESTSWQGVTHSIDNGGLGFGFKWNMGWMNDFLSYMKQDPFFRKYEHSKITFSLMYAFNENFILPLSHDEVVHGKSPMLYKMPGDEWQKFANLRAAYGYLYMHPGKKMLFMGNEFGQTKEWDEKGELQWGLLQHEPHTKMQGFVRDLNAFYKENKCLWQQDHTYNGFRWIDCDNKDQSIVSFIRKGEEAKDDLIVVVNFTPEVRHNFRIGVEQLGSYEEVLTSDDLKYYGSGMSNGVCEAEEGQWKDLPASIGMSVAPLAIMVFKRVQEK